MSIRFTIALNADPPPMPLDELLCDEQSNSCADCSPCREEGVKDLRQILRGNSHSIIFNRQDNAISLTRALQTETERIPPLDMA